MRKRSAKTVWLAVVSYCMQLFPRLCCNAFRKTGIYVVMAWHIVSYRISRYWGRIVAYLYRNNYPFNKVDILHNSNRECRRHHVALNAVGNIDKGSLVLDAMLYNRPSMTGTHLYPDGRPRWPISLPTTPVKQICHGNIQSAAESVGEEGRQQRVVNNRCETMAA